MLDVGNVETLNCGTPHFLKNRITDGVVTRQAHSIWARRLARLSLFWYSKQIVVDLDILLTSGSGKPSHCVPPQVPPTTSSNGISTRSRRHKIEKSYKGSRYRRIQDASTTTETVFSNFTATVVHICELCEITSTGIFRVTAFHQ